MNAKTCAATFGTSVGSLIGARSTNQTPIGVFLQYIGTDLQRQARFAKAAHAEEGQQARAVEQFLDVGKLALAPDEGCDLLREIVRCRPRASGAREIAAELRMNQLVDMLRRGQISQPHTAQVSQGCLRRQAAS